MTHSMPYKDMPDTHEVLELDGVFSAEQVERMHEGYTPQSETDRWNIRFDGKTLNFYRAKSLSHIFQLKIEPVLDHFIAPELIVNRNPKQYVAISAEFDVQLVAYLIDTYLFGRTPSFPFPRNLNAQHRDAFMKSMVGYASPQPSGPTIKLDSINFN